MPDAEHRVVYKAHADFSELYAEIAKANAALRTLNQNSAAAGRTSPASGGSGAGAASAAPTAAQIASQQRIAEAHQERMNQLRAKGASAEATADEKRAAAARREVADNTRLANLRAAASKREIADNERLAQLRATASRREVADAERLTQLRAAGGRREIADFERIAAARQKADRAAIADFERMTAAREKADRAAIADEEKLGQARAAGSRRAAADEERMARARETASRRAALDEERLTQTREAGARRASAEEQRTSTARENANRKRIADETRYGQLLTTHARREFDAAVSRERRDEAYHHARMRRERALQTEQLRSRGWVGNLGQGVGNVGRRLRGRDDDEMVGGSTLAPVSAAADKAGKSVQDLFGKFTRLFAIIGAIALAAGPAIAALGALGAVALGAGNAMISLAGALFALPGLFAAGATSIAALIVAINPLVDVFKAYAKTQKAASASSVQSAAQARQAADATRNAERAYRSAIESRRNALEQEWQAQVDLNVARRDALRDLQDLRHEVERSSLNEASAILSLKEAQEQYNQTLADPGSSANDRERALLRVKDAEFDLRDVRQKNIRLREDATVAERRGVEGSQRVVDAQRNARNATEAVADATARLADATQDLKDSQLAQAAGGTTALRAQQEFDALIAQLGPHTRAVVLGLLDMGKAWKDLSRNVSDRLFAPLVGQLGNLRSLLPVVEDLLGDAAEAMGDVAAKGIEMLSSGPWRADFATISEQNAGLIRSLGDAALSVVDAFRNIIVAAGPFTQWVGEAIARVADGFARWSAEARNSGDLAKFLDDTRERLQLMGGVFGNLFDLVHSLYNATKDFTTYLLNGLAEMTQGWADWAKAAEQPNSNLHRYLEDIKPLLSATRDFLGAIADAFVDIAKDPRNIEEMKRVLEILSDRVLPGIVEMVGSLSESQTLSKIAGGFGDLLGAINDFLDAGGTLPLTIFVDTLLSLTAALVQLMSMPGIGQFLSALFAGLAAFAAASFVLKITGLKRLFDGLLGTMGKTGIIKQFFKTMLDEAAYYISRLTNLVTNGRFGAPKRAPGEGGTGWTGKAPEQQAQPYAGVLGRILEELIAIRTCVCRPEVECTCKPTGASTQVDPDTGEVGAAGGLRGAAAALDRAAVQLMVAARALQGAAGLEALGSLPLPGNRRTPGRALPRGIQRELPGRTPQRALGGDRRTARVIEGEIVEEGVESATRRAAPRAAASAGTAAAERAAARTGAGLLGKIGLGAGKLGLGIADPLLLPGLALGLAGDYAFKDRQSTGAQAARAGGAILTGAGIGASLTGPLAPVGALVGGTIGAGYSYAKDKPFRDKINQSGLAGPVGSLMASGSSGAPDEGMWDTFAKGFTEKVSDPVGAFFSDTLPKFFTETIPDAAGDLFDSFSDFFTETLPGFIAELPDKIGDAAEELGHTVGEALRSGFLFLTEDVPHFITETLPNFFTETIPRWFTRARQAFDFYVMRPIRSFVNGIPGFFTRTIPRWFNAATGAFNRYVIRPVRNFISGIPGFFTRTIPRWFSSVYNFFTVDVADKIKGFVTVSIPKFFTDTIPGVFKRLYRFFADDVITPIGDFISKIPERTVNAVKESPLGRFLKGVYEGATGKSEDGKQSGGLITGTPTGRVDSKLVPMTVGEFVVRQRVAGKPHAKQLLHDLNEERIDPAALYAALNFTANQLNIPTTAVSRYVPSVSNSVTNNSSSVRNSGMSIGDVTINNPIRERSERSLRRNLQSLALMGQR